MTDPARDILTRGPGRPETTLDKPFTGSGFQPKPYDISYRTLVPQKVSNLLVAGRCHSASSEASASSRVTATAMALGEAAGTAAALAMESKDEVGTLGGVKFLRHADKAEIVDSHHARDAGRQP